MTPLAREILVERAARELFAAYQPVETDGITRLPRWACAAIIIGISLGLWLLIFGAAWRIWP